jgi:type IV secretion system protein VirD4
MRKLLKVLVLLRSAGVRVVMATQDLNEIERVYSKEDLETIISETYIKQFLAVIRSKRTLDWLASYLGETSVTVSSFSMSKDGAQESLSRAARKLMTEDELRRLPEDAQVIFYGNNKPILAKKVQVFAISKWRKSLGINLGYGTKRKLLPVEVRFRWWGTEVTPRGVRLYRKMERASHTPDRKFGRFLAELLPRIVPVSALVTVVVIAMAVTTLGLPNLRWEYAYRGPARDAPVSYTWCRYIGPTSPGTIGGPACPLFLWRKP